MVENSKEDFQKLRAVMSDRWGVARLSNQITKVKTIIKFAKRKKMLKHDLDITEEFKRPSKKLMRKHRNESSNKLIECDQIRLLLDAASYLKHNYLVFQ